MGTIHGALVVVTLAWVASAPPVAHGDDREALVDRGRAVFAASGGCSCHTADGEALNAGGRAVETDFGTFYGTNVTPDRVHGIGAWTDREILDSIRLGVRPDGSVLSPVMPYPAFAGLADDDGRALVAFLRSVAPSTKENRPHEDTPIGFGLAMRAWRWWAFDPAPPPAAAPTTGLARGRYLVEHVGHCGECHTPRSRLGMPIADLRLAGAIVEGEPAPNLTPDLRTGLGDWTIGEIRDLVLTGFLPNMDNVQGLMALLIEGLPHGYRHLDPEDATWIARYLKSLDPIENEVESKKKEKR